MTGLLRVQARARTAHPLPASQHESTSQTTSVSSGLVSRTLVAPSPHCRRISSQSYNRPVDRRATHHSMTLEPLSLRTPTDPYGPFLVPCPIAIRFLFVNVAPIDKESSPLSLLPLSSITSNLVVRATIPRLLGRASVKQPLAHFLHRAPQILAEPLSWTRSGPLGTDSFSTFILDPSQSSPGLAA